MWWRLFVVAALMALMAPLGAQPDPRRMAGIPRPVDDLPHGSVSVRVIRGALINNIPNQAVELHVGSDALTVRTDADGRAQFDTLPPGAILKAVAIVDGERLESQEFPAPAQGGIRLLLVATGDSGSAAASTAPAGPPAVAGQVAIGGQSRFILQPGEESVEVYYLLDIMNNSAAPVNPPTPFAFDMPPGATGTGILEGSSPLASINGLRVTVNGPFPPGSTRLRVGTSFTVASGSFDLVQRFPAALANYAVIVKKVGETKMSSSQLAGQQVLPAQGETLIGANGAPVAAGQPLTVSLTDMPHHSATPRRTALALAVGIMLVGVWTATRKYDDSAVRINEHKPLIARREKLLADLVRLERGQHDDGREGRGEHGARGDHDRARREEIVAALEQVYGALDFDGLSPEPGHAGGVAA